MCYMEYALAPIVGGVVAILVWVFRSAVENFRKEKERLNSERVGLYKNVLEPYIQLFAKPSKKETQKIMAHISSYEYRKAFFELNIFGSDEVVREFNLLMQIGFANDQSGDAGVKMMGQFCNVMLAIRRDVGNKKTFLEQWEMLESQITDLYSMPGIERPQYKQKRRRSRRG